MNAADQPNEALNPDRELQKNGAGDGDRTHDILLGKQTLYH